MFTDYSDLLMQVNFIQNYLYLIELTYFTKCWKVSKWTITTQNFVFSFVFVTDSVQRFDYSVLTPFLPPKHEYVVSVKMSNLQIQLYQHYLEYHAKGGPGNIGRGKGTPI